MKAWIMTGALLAGAFIAGGAGAQADEGQQNPANPLVTDKWNFRPLIILTPDPHAPAYQHLRAQLERSQDQFDSRDMVLYTIEGTQGTRHGQPMTAYETDALVKALGVSPDQGVTTVLVGKDGGKKVEQRGDIDLQQIYDTIDRMPMRRAGSN
ncbi:DUF4174 domain-containing protein [Salinicola rhizosphaerae]|uniref:DUF4174 domain-containing protein n=1 Tax=Salinicola rhizosphaerae TaxID=1443141 RepID=A0ABQ3E3L1_9GAMM|nr:DUF4174 domain-containing protein [Salinicola rhizosphaerae]GHB24719.1 hypothetical protein GCM10009038_24750 [Salinicola rhizosphaerae]